MKSTLFLLTILLSLSCSEKTGVNILKEASETEFGTIKGQESEAINYLIKQLSSGKEITLNNENDAEGEGYSIFRVQDKTFEFREGGHGWSGEWTKIEREELIKKLHKLVLLNDGSHWSKTGKIRER